MLRAGFQLLLLFVALAIDVCCPLETLLKPSDGGRRRPSSRQHSLSPGPYFDHHRTRNVTAFEGVTAYLVCRVRRLGNNTVSWIRERDTTLISVGRYTYTTDQRFEAFHRPHSDDWVIRLKNPRASDDGEYHCQVSTTPHRTARIFLTVQEPSSYIIGGPDLFVDVGSMVNISCVVLNTDKPPDTVKWLHGDEEISFRGPRNGVSVITEKAERTSINLLMQDANAADSGFYTCVPNNAPASKIKVHILTGNQVAGLQTNSSSGRNSVTTTIAAALSLLFTIPHLLPRVVRRGD